MGRRRPRRPGVWGPTSSSIGGSRTSSPSSRTSPAGGGADVVYDPVGGVAYQGSTKCVAFEGRIVVVGFAGGIIPTPALNHALVKNYSILGLHWGLYRAKDPDAVVACHRELTRLADASVIRTLIGERLPFDAAPAGLARLAAGDALGRLVVLP